MVVEEFQNYDTKILGVSIIFSNPCMFLKHEFKLEMYVTVCLSYGKWRILIISRSVLLVDNSVWFSFMAYQPL